MGGSESGALELLHRCPRGLGEEELGHGEARGERGQRWVQRKAVDGGMQLTALVRSPACGYPHVGGLDPLLRWMLDGRNVREWYYRRTGVCAQG
jgi:hypothetical protein